MIYICKGCKDVKLDESRPCLFESSARARPCCCPLGLNLVDWVVVDVRMNLLHILKMFLADNDFRNEGTGIDKEDSPEIEQVRQLLEAIS